MRFLDLDEVEAGQIDESGGVLRLECDEAFERLDRVIRVPLRLVRGREIAKSRRIAGILRHALLGIVDRGHARAARAAEDVADSHSSGADPEAHEAEPEDQREEQEHPLRVPAQLGEEHGVLDRYGLVAGRRSRPRALRATSISSSHVFPPFS